MGGFGGFKNKEVLAIGHASEWCGFDSEYLRSSGLECIFSPADDRWRYPNLHLMPGISVSWTDQKVPTCTILSLHCRGRFGAHLVESGEMLGVVL